MGDNRYYTFIQFYSVIVLTVVAGAALFSGVYRSVRNGRDPGLFWGMSSMLFFAVSSVARIVEWVIPDFGLAASCREVFLWSMLAGVFCVIAYRGRWLIGHRFAFLTVGYRRWFVLVPVLAVMMILPRYVRLVKAYAYPVITYSMIFLVLMIYLTALYISQALVRHIRWMKGHKNKNRQRELASLCAAVYGGFLLVYLWLIPDTAYRNGFEYLLLVLGILVMHLLVDAKNSFGITSAAFDNVVRLLPEYIVVTDMAGTVIYSNRPTGRYRHFSPVRSLTEASFDQLMHGKTEIKKNKDGRFYIKVQEGDQATYYLYSKSMVGKEGILYSFLDMTELIGMLNDLEVLQKELAAVNSKLKDEKTMTYRLEQEKEVNALMEEVTQIQEASMMALVESIQDLLDEGVDFYQEIDKALAATNRILTEVRKAVRTYREYYGG